MTSESIQMDVRPVSEAVSEAGWYLGYGYGMKPLVLYASRGQTVWRDGVRQVAITTYVGPLPERIRVPKPTSNGARRK